MNPDSFEDMFADRSPRRLHTLDKPPHTLRLLSIALLGLAILCGIAWEILK